MRMPAPSSPLTRVAVCAFAAAGCVERAELATPSADRITLLRDADRDGEPEVRTTFAAELHEGLDREPRRHAPVRHRGLEQQCRRAGFEAERQRAAILEIDPATGATAVYASGLRNPNGLAWEPRTGALWTVVNERDEIGSDLVPDYLTSVERGAFYGWPYSYFGAHVDERVEPENRELVQSARVPDYALGAHTASLGLSFYERDALPPEYGGGAFVAQHGSWNRRPPSGYRATPSRSRGEALELGTC
jgi:hypothetical protein